MDSDAHIEAQTGITVREIFETKGEAAFRELELLFVNELDAVKNTVVSLGGGLPCFNNLMERLNLLGTVIYLETSVSTLTARLEAERLQRPLLQGVPNLEEYIAQKLSERAVFYEQAHFCVTTDQLSVEAITTKCADLLV